MGCASSSASKAAAEDKKDSKDAKGGEGAKGGGASSGVLLDHYTLGPVLGQGAFGVVYSCTKKNGTGEFAVKMIDKVETPVDEIKREADMMMMLSHDNVVKLHEVFYEKCFVCIVMDRYKGGDLIVGMQKHWKSKGKIPAEGSVHIMKQMVASIAFLHESNVVHRDIKGDNYLMDRSNIVDQQCKIFLSDFGTATKIQKGERLKQAVGTRTYWPPEFFNKDYGLKVDVWAVGVVIYGLLDGRFPFKGEPDVRYKKVVLPQRVNPTCTDMVQQMLKKEESKRPSSADVLAHEWLGQASKDTGNEPAEKMDAEIDREEGANEGVRDRRQELVDRLERQGNAGGGPKGAEFWDSKFEVVDKRTNWKHTFEWWPEDKVLKEGVLKLDGVNQSNMASMGQNDKGNVEVVGKMLKEHSIDIDQFGKGEAKTLEKFAEEVQSGAARLMLDATEHKKLVRVVDVVLLRLHHGNDKSKVFLTEVGEKFSDGRVRMDLNRLPGTKKEPFENTKRTAERILKELLNMGDCKVNLDLAKKEVFEEETDSISYPGVRTVYRKEIVGGKFSSTDTAVMQRVGLNASKAEWSFESAGGNTKFFAWYSDKQCTDKNVKLRAPAKGDEVSGLVQAPIGFNEEALREFMKENQIDAEKFGQGQTRTLKEFSNELIKGESSLMRQPDGQVLRIVDIVLMKLCKAGTSDILVETGETRPEGNITHNRLPGSKRRPDENQFVTARRILKRQLMIGENYVTLNAKDVQIVEEEKASPSYPGLRTMYRKRIIKGEIVPKSAN